MITAAKLQVEFGSSGVDGVKNDITGLSGALDGIGKKFMGVGKKMTVGVSVPIVGAGVMVVNWAADLDESINKTNVLFDQNAAAMLAWSENSAKAFGMSQQASLDYSSAFAGMFKHIASTPDELMNMSQEMTKLTADFGSFHNLNPEEAFTVIQSALAGETEAIRRYGVDVSAAAVETKALEMGLAETTAEITEQDKALARYEIIMDQTSDAHDDFRNTSDSTSNRMKIFRANLQDTGATFGRILLPAVNSVLSGLLKFLGVMGDLSPKLQAGVVGFLAIAAAIGPLLLLIGGMAAGLSALLPVIAGVGAAFTVLLPVLAAVGLAIAAYKTNFLGFGDFVDSAISGLSKFSELLFGIPESKGIGITLDTSLTGEEDAWSNWTKMPDGSWKHATLDITTQGLDGTVEEILDPVTGEKSYVLNVDVDGNGVADATKIIDSVDQGGGKFVMTVEIDGKKYEAWYDEKTGETIIVPMEVELTNEGEIAGKLNKWKNRRETFEIVLKVINLDILGRVQDLSNAAFALIQAGADATVSGITSAFSAVGDSITALAQGFVDGIMSIFDTIESAYNAVKNLLPGGGNSSETDAAPTNTGMPATSSNASPFMGAGDGGAGAMAAAMGASLATMVATNQAAWSTITSDTSAGSLAAQAAASGAFTQMSADVTTTVIGMGGEVGSQMGALTGTVGAQAGAANAAATEQFASMNASAAGHFMGMQANAAMQMAMMAATASSQGAAMNTGMTGWLAGAVAQIAGSLSVIPGIIAGIGGSAAVTAYSIGANISSSFAAGMYASLGAIQGAASAMVAAASNALRAKAMISSPSKLFRKYGEYVGEGFEQGITSSIPGIHNAADAMIGAGVPGGIGSRGAAVAGGGISVNFAGATFHNTSRAEMEAWAAQDFIPAIERASASRRRQMGVS